MTMRISGVRILAALGLTALALSACLGSSSGGQRLSGGTATWAEAPNAKPNYIMPLMSGAYFSVANLSQFSNLIYRPLYWFGSGNVVKLNSDLSLAKDPVYTDGGK